MSDQEVSAGESSRQGMRGGSRPGRGIAHDPERFRSRLRFANGECWEWTGPRTRKGYGRLWSPKGRMSAHRHAWELAHGPIPEGKIVRHECDNPPCCNPAHLRLGTQADNMRDMSRRARRSWAGDANPNAKLSIEQRQEIRERYVPRVNGTKLAEEYGVSLGTIMLVVGVRRAVAKVA